MIRIINMTFRESRRVIAWFKFANSLIFKQHCFRSMSSNYEATFDRVLAMTCNHLYSMSTWNKIKTCYRSFYKISTQIAQKSNRINSSRARTNECHSRFSKIWIYFWLERIHFWIENVRQNFCMRSRFCLYLHNNKDR